MLLRFCSLLLGVALLLCGMDGSRAAPTVTRQTTDGHPHTLASLMVEPATVIGGAQAATVIVTLASAAPPGGTVITLRGSGTLVSVPASVTVPEGASVARVRIATSAVSNERTITLMADCDGDHQEASVSVRPVHVAMVSVAADELVGGQAGQGQVILECPAGSGGATVTLTSSASAVAEVPQTVALPAGATTAAFTLTTHVVSTTADVTVSASTDEVTQATRVRVIAGPRDVVNPIAFLPPIEFAKPGAWQLTSGDFDGDGRLDLAVNGGAGVSIFFGNGDGSFGSPVAFEGQGFSMYPCGVDVNRDGRLDLVVADQTGNRMLVFLNQGERTFGPATPYGLGTAPRYVAAADFNEDGWPDLFVAPAIANECGVLLNRKDGTFQTPSRLGPSEPTQAAIADFNEDGHLDVATDFNGARGVQVFLGDGAGHFATGQSILLKSATMQPIHIFARDFDGDGHLDLVSTEKGLALLLGKGDGTFHSVYEFRGSYPYSNASGDLDGDGYPEIIRVYGHAYFTVLYNDGTGSFLHQPRLFYSGAEGFRTPVIGDFNGDGRPDVAVTNLTTGAVAVFMNDTPRPVLAVRSVTLDPARVTGGLQAMTGTILLNAPAPSGGSIVTLATTSDALTVPDSVTIAEGAIRARFVIQTAPVSRPQTEILTASLSESSQSVLFRVMPISVAQIALSANAVTGGEGLDVDVKLIGPAGPGGVTVTLTSSALGAATLPTTITVPAGADTARFHVETQPGTSTATVTLAASTAGGAQTVVLTVTPPPPPPLAPLPPPPVQHITVLRPSTHEWFLRSEDGGAAVVRFGVPEDVPVPADYLGTGRPQITVFRPSTREWWIGTDLGPIVVPFGGPDDVPVPGDYFGLGRAQIAVFRKTTGEWFLRRDDGSATVVPFGEPGDIPVPADYLGLHRSQLAVFRPTTDEWRIRMDDGTPIGTRFGTPGDVPVPGDYLAEGRDQIAVFQPGSALWFIRPGDGSLPIKLQFGGPNDVPVPADYFGLGRLQIGVFRPGEAEWYLRTDQGRTVTIQWGGPEDQPVTSNFPP